MTTPNEELILKLRGQAYTSYRPDQLCDQAADLLQSQAERIKELESECLNTDVRLATAIEQREQMRAAIAATEPVTHQFQTVDGGWHPFLDDRHFQNTKDDGRWPIRALFTHPMPAQDVEDAARYRWIRLHCYVDTFRSHPRSDLSMFDAAIDAARAKGAK